MRAALIARDRWAGQRRGLVGGAYDFAKYATPVLHLHDEAADITVTGLGVSAWVNKVGGMTVAQSSDPDRPAFLGEGAGVDFDIANTEHLALGSIPALASNAFTLVLDIDIQSTGAVRYLLDLNGTARLIFCLGVAAGVHMGFYDGSFRSAGAAWAPTTGRQTLTFRYLGDAPGVCEIRRDSVSLGTAAAGAVGDVGGGTTSKISRNATSAAAWVDAILHRLVFYPASLSAPQMTEIEASL